MAKKDDLPADMWLHVATDALARYAAGGGLIVVALDDGPGVVLRLPDVALNDPRLAPSFLSVCLLYTSDAADERSSVDLGGRRII